MSDIDEYRAEWHAAFAHAGHAPELDEDGKPDEFARSGGYHNGLQCRLCGWGQCMWCGKPEDIPACTGQKPPEPPSELDLLRQRVADMTRALERCRVILANDQWGTIDYMEGSQVYNDLRRGVEIIDAALASSDSK